MSDRQLQTLLIAGGRYVQAALHGRGSLGVPTRSFTMAVLESLRPHYFAIPAGAALAGAAAAGGTAVTWRIGAAAAASGLGWGVGQLLNDLLDRDADAIDAPGRASVRGLLPDGPTMTVAEALGLVVTAVTLCVHRQAYQLAAASIVLLLGYGACKRVPLLGNLAHGALIACAAAIGALAASPEQSIGEVLARAWPACGLAGAWAAIYLQANYEKDRRGDERAGHRTLAHVLGLRKSASLRLLLGVAAATAAFSMGLLTTKVAWAMGGLALLLLTLSAGSVLVAGTEAQARRTYRLAVHAATTGMIALGHGVLGLAPVGLLIIASAGLTEWAIWTKGLAA